MTPPKKFKPMSPLKKAPRHKLDVARGLLSGAQGGYERPTGWKLFDQSSLRLRSSELTLIFGRSSHGKTNFMLNLLLNWLEQGRDERFLYYSLEMTAHQAATRLLAMLMAKRGGINMTSTQAARYLSGADKPTLAAQAAMGLLKQLEERLVFIYEPLWDVERVAADSLARSVDGPKIGSIFVDPISSLAAPIERSNPQRRDLELSYISRRLKELAVRLSCPLIAAAPSRPLQGEEAGKLRALLAGGREFTDLDVEDAIRSRRPRLNHLPEYSLEQEADLILGLLSHLSDYHGELEPEHRQVFSTKSRGTLEISALKNRQGSLDSAELQMDLKSSLIVSEG